MLPRKSALTAWPIQSSLSGGCCTNSGKYYPSAGLDSWKVRTVSSEESSGTDVGKFCMVNALAREVDRSKHRSVYRGGRDRVDAYAHPRWWCCSPHQLTLLLPLFNHQFSGASNQLRIKHLSSGLRATIYQHKVPMCGPPRLNRVRPLPRKVS